MPQMRTHPVRETQPAPETFISVENVTREFVIKRKPMVTALSHVDLSIERGEFVSLIGPSGCGKSTLLSLIAGLDRPTSGSVKVAGKSVTGPFTSAGVVFQQDLLMEWRTCLDNVLLQLQLRHRLDPAGKVRARQLLDMVGVGQFASSRPRQLSGGMRQRVAICRALVHEPDLLLMDEPFGALDAITREKLNVDLSRIVAETNKTVVFVTHSIEEAVFLSDRVIVMTPRPGRIAADIPIEIDKPRSEELLREPDFLNVVAAVRGELDATGAFA